MRILICAILLAVTSGLLAQESVTPRPEYQTQRIEGEPPTIDGKLDDAAWNQVEWGGDFYQRQPDDSAPVSQETSFKILYDNRYLYVAWRAYDTEAKLIEARLGRRDEFPGDWVEINFDSFNDKRTGFSFSASASGVRGDEFISNDGNNWDSSWNPFWFFKSQIDDEGYTVEARIPFSQLRFGKDEIQEWGLQVNRNLFREQESSSWSPIKQTQPGWVSRFGTLKGLSGIKPRKPLEIQPYVLGQIRTGGGFADADPFDRKTEERLSVGLDGRIGITNDIAVDFTVNPDFGQVEADPGAINLDGFQIFFREQRPFFVENRNIFDYSVTSAEAGGQYNSDLLFYSRRIGGSPSRRVRANNGVGRFVQQPENTTILGAAKVSGKTREGLSLGILSSFTEREFATVIDTTGEFEEEVEPFTSYNVGRVQQDFNKRQSTIGVMVTRVDRNLRTDQLDFLHNQATSSGVDLVHRWKDRAWSLRANMVFSNVSGSQEAITRTQRSFEHLFQRPDADHLGVDTSLTSLSGTGGTVSIGEFDGDWVFQSGFTYRSPGLELNDIGFLTNTDQINYFAWGARRWRNPTKFFNRFQWNQNIYMGWDFAGNSLNRSYNTNFWGQTKGFSNFNYFLNLEQQDISKNALRGGPLLRRSPGYFTGGGFGSDYRKRFNVYLNFGFGGSYDGNVRGANIGLDFNYQPIDALSLYASPSIDWGSRNDQYFDQQSDDGRIGYLHGSIEQQTLSITLRATINLTPDFTIQYYGQPFVARGVYDNFKNVADPLARDFGDRFYTFSNITFDEENNEFLVDDDDDSEVDFEFRNPDFNFLQFRSNLVVRWEYRPSSTIFLVWSQGLVGNADPSKGVLSALSDDLFGNDVRNTFLVKATYRWVR
ncbi:hydrolase [Lewinellaceae bacterium SD302]|nr:hydrolase [Lewinellaceae bacterium SD302]